MQESGLVEPVHKLSRSRRPVFDKAGKPVLIDQPTVRIHDLRHSFASILVSAGASLPLIGQLLGHTQVQTTQRYAHLFDEPMREAAEAVAVMVRLPKPSRGSDLHQLPKSRNRLTRQ